ncbi:J domain-containing protein [Arthrobacter sp. CDRTa11]|uniref:J domain-containing protein n=1 Tax=Arthrobacter sp. CDRTa11 TaxID=2651199 RepID=UPI002265E446|nr:J domain-containing protein [Arthrobacter sp. CDRTa11]UZX05600.1 J domain-containing protein [Arthrobacter sp. CDRTa11]
MESLPDYYAVLHVGPAATQREISRAYRALMRTHHPDVDGSDAADRKAQDNKLLGIMQAFAVLRDPVRRADYDRSVRGQSVREQGAREQGASGQGNKGYGGTSRGRGEQETAEQETAGQETVGRETAEQGSSAQAGGRRFRAQNTGDSVPQDIPVRKVRSRAERSGHTIRITPVRWESGPWA